MTEVEATAARMVILKVVDSNVWGYVCDHLEDKLAKDMLNARDAPQREEIAAEHRVMQKFLNTLTEISNQLRNT